MKRSCPQSFDSPLQPANMRDVHLQKKNHRKKEENEWTIKSYFKTPFIGDSERPVMYLQHLALPFV